MKRILTLACLTVGALYGRGDALSGPGRTTIQTASWGTLYFEPDKAGDASVTHQLNDTTVTTGEGRVTIKGTESNGFELSCGTDRLLIRPLNGGGGIEVKGKTGSWTLRSSNGTTTLIFPKAEDTLTFKRNANTFSIEGPRGRVEVTAEPGTVQIQSPLGTTTISGQYGNRTFQGPPLDRIPYLGRGLFLSFHGVGVFLDVARLFPMPEVSEWEDWKPMLKP